MPTHASATSSTHIYIFTSWSGTPTHQTHVDQKFLLSSVNVTLTVKRPMSSLNLLESYLNVVIVGEVTKAVAEEVDETLDTGHQPALWAICLGGHSPTPSEKIIYWQWDNKCAMIGHNIIWMSPEHRRTKTAKLHSPKFLSKQSRDTNQKAWQVVPQTSHPWLASLHRRNPN